MAFDFLATLQEWIELNAEIGTLYFSSSKCLYMKLFVGHYKFFKQD